MLRYRWLVLMLSLSPCIASALPEPGKKPSALYCMATNVFYEARGDGWRSQLLVALVTANRSLKRKQGICDVVYRRNQFSWTRNPPSIDRNSEIERAAWREAMRISKDVMKALRHKKRFRKIDFTRGATHYHAIMHSRRPIWASKLVLLGRAGSHLYYIEPSGKFN